MQLSDAPGKIVLPFAEDGNKNVIPVPSQIPITPGAASYTDGFPPLTMMAVTAGGQPPSGFDMNGILNAATAVDRWLNAGASFPYDATFSTAIGGYPRGARVLQASGVGFWVSSVDNNTTDPDTGGAGWLPQGVTAVASVYALAQQTLPSGFSKVQFDTVEFDANGLWDAANKRFTAKYAGNYRISGALFLSAPDAQVLTIQLWKNGIGVKECFKMPQVSDGDLTLPYNAIINCVLGDYLETFFSAAQSAVLAGTTGSNEAFVYSQIEYLGQ